MRTITPKQVSERFGVTVATLGQWRRMGTGPMFNKVGGRVYYDLASVVAFFAPKMAVQESE